MGRRWWAVLALVAGLQGCGGGGDADDVGQALASARMALQDPAACVAGGAAASDGNGNCVTAFGAMAPQRLGKQALGAQYSLPNVTADRIFDWASGAYPQFFAGSYHPGSVAVPPFGTFNYRYYPATGNYLASLGTGIYVYGPVSDYEIQLVGQITDFACLVQSCGGSGAGTGAASGGATGTSGGTLSVGAPVTGALTSGVQTVQYSVYLQAGTSYVITMRGAGSNGGTLSDPLLSLYDAGGNTVASNDDAAGQDTLDAQLTITPRTSGTYRVAASTYRADVGTFTLGVSTAGSSGSGGASSGGSGTGSGATGYITWTGSLNGTTVKDGSNEDFQIRASDRAVVTASNVVLTGLTVDSSADVRSNGQIIGYLGLAQAASGSGNVAVFHCPDGEYMDIIVTNTWTTSCGSSGGSAGGGSTGGGGTGGGGSGGSSRGFYTWSNSANGEVVLDATDERFRFYADSGCIYSDNTRTEYTNFCLSGGARVYFGGQTYSVSAVRSTTGSCIAGLLTYDGYFADVYTSSGRVEYIQKSGRRPAAC